MKLYRFHWACGRNGDLSGIFVAAEAEVQEAIGQLCEFGEVLGKHSDVYDILKAEDITEVPCSDTFAEEFRKIVGASIGHNPLEALVLPHPEGQEEDCPRERLCEQCFHGQDIGYAKRRASS